jgi:hypothetical protein
LNIPDDVMRRCRHALTSVSNWPDEQIRAVLNAAGYGELLDHVSELETKLARPSGGNHYHEDADDTRDVGV